MWETAIATARVGHNFFPVTRTHFSEKRRPHTHALKRKVILVKEISIDHRYELKMLKRRSEIVSRHFYNKLE